MLSEGKQDGASAIFYFYFFIICLCACLYYLWRRKGRAEGMRDLFLFSLFFFPFCFFSFSFYLVFLDVIAAIQNLSASVCRPSSMHNNISLSKPNFKPYFFIE